MHVRKLYIYKNHVIYFMYTYILHITTQAADIFKICFIKRSKINSSRIEYHKKYMQSKLKIFINFFLLLKRDVSPTY